MTNERAIELLHRISDSQFDGIHGDERREALEMAVRALFSQQIFNDSQGLVNDCISRKMAIDAVAKWFYDVFGIKESDGTATIFKRLRELPSVQPVNYGATKSDSSSQLKLNNDLISRKQVLNASHFVACWDGVEHFSLEVVDADFIQKLPSVQPTQPNAQSTQINTLDCVSRQAAINILHEEHSGYITSSEEGLIERIAERIQQLPSAQPVNYGATKSDSSSQLKLNNDLISRKQVLNASHFVACWDGVEHFSLEVVDADFIQKLPSVQPTQTNADSTQTNADSTQTNALDCVSREAVLDAIDKYILGKPEGDTVEVKELLKLITKIYHMPIYRIPYPQPERKKGRWIWWYEEAVTEHATEYTPHCKCSECGRECAPSVATYSNFCRNCGADMRGESDV